MKVKTLLKLLKNVDPEREVFMYNGNFAYETSTAKELNYVRDKEYLNDGYLMDDKEIKKMSKEDRKGVKVKKGFVIF